MPDNNIKTREQQYNEVKKYLIEKMGYEDPPDDAPILLNSGDNSVFMRGPFAGYSLSGLKRFVADVEGRKIQYDPDDVY